MTTPKDNNSCLVMFSYRAGLFWLNAYVFFKMSSLAVSFIRTWAGAYSSGVNHVLIFLFGLGFFVNFNNFSRIVLSLEENETGILLKSFKKISAASVFLLLIMLLLQAIPELLRKTQTPY